MKKYHGVIRLNSSQSTDFSTIDLTEFDESRTDLDLVLDMSGDASHAQIGHAHPNLYYTIDSRRLASKHKKSQRDRKLLDSVKQFNLDPKKGLAHLQNAGFVKNTPKDVAIFLFRQERLSKKQIGTYLGSHHDFNKEVLSHFVQCHEFTKLLLVQALRQFLWSFRLPGEAMQIDRVMDAFASHYCCQNPNLFEEPDTCFILSFSIIMLNTALHNPNAKMKVNDF
jgi:Sec7-like guanine-nucleotide exchange factor